MEGRSLGHRGAPLLPAGLDLPRSSPGPPPTASPLAHAPASWSWGRREGQMWTCPEPLPSTIQPSLLPPPSLAGGPQLDQSLSLDLEMLGLVPQQKCLPRARPSSRGRPEPAGSPAGRCEAGRALSLAPPPLRMGGCLHPEMTAPDHVTQGGHKAGPTEGWGSCRARVPTVLRTASGGDKGPRMERDRWWPGVAAGARGTASSRESGQRGGDGARTRSGAL